jgi:hypothetical protein
MKFFKNFFNNSKTNRDGTLANEKNIQPATEAKHNALRFPLIKEKTVGQETLKVLVYGFECWGFRPSTEKENVSGFSIEYGRLHDAPPFQDHDIVIIPQGIFEAFRTESNALYRLTEHSYYGEELTKRTREYVFSLKRKTVFCFLVTKMPTKAELFQS